ncbi:MAG: BatA domain-containing protein [Candidatus Binataceae bacterium]
MGFLNPAKLVWALAIAALLLIYLRSRSRPTLEVSSLMLFDDMPAPVASVRHVRLDPLFWLELFGLSALVLAIAGLYAMTPVRAGRGRSHALVFDLGAAMSAREGASTRLELARRDALKIIAGAPAGDEFSVITYALEAQVPAPQTANLALVKAAIDRLEPLAVAAMPAALSATIIRARGSSEIDLFTDRNPPAETIGAAVGQAAVRVHRIGHDDGNLAIAGLDPGTPGSTLGRAIVRNFSATPHLVDLVVDLDGQEVAHQPLMLAPREQVIVPFGPLKSGGIVRAQILTQDAIAADNQRWAIARSDGVARALVLSPDAEVRADLARVLLAINPNFQVETIDPAKFTSSKSAAPAQRYDLTVMHDCDVPGVAARARLLIYPPLALSSSSGGKIPGLRIEGTARSAAMSSERGAEPAGGADAALGATRIMRLPEWMNPLNYATHGSEGTVIPIVAVGEVTGGRAAVVAFDVRDHFLFDPDRLGALIALVNVTRRVTAPAGVQVVPTGAFVTLAVSGAAQLTEPDGARVTLHPDQWGRVRLQPLQAGRYVIDSAGTHAIVLANYYDAAESDLGAMREAAPAPKPPTLRAEPAAAGPKQVFPLALILIAMAMIAFLAESILLVRHAARLGMTHV